MATSAISAGILKTSALFYCSATARSFRHPPPPLHFKPSPPLPNKNRHRPSFMHLSSPLACRAAAHPEVPPPPPREPPSPPPIELPIIDPPPGVVDPPPEMPNPNPGPEFPGPTVPSPPKPEIPLRPPDFLPRQPPPDVVPPTPPEIIPQQPPNVSPPPVM